MLLIEMLRRGRIYRPYQNIRSATIQTCPGQRGGYRNGAMTRLMTGLDRFDRLGLRVIGGRSFATPLHLGSVR